MYSREELEKQGAIEPKEELTEIQVKERDEFERRIREIANGVEDKKLRDRE